MQARKMNQEAECKGKKTEGLSRRRDRKKIMGEERDVARLIDGRSA